jgi:hypothetical protein
MTIEKLLLPYRGNRHKHERLNDYIARISSRNGFSSIDAFKNYLNRGYSNIEGSEYSVCFKSAYRRGVPITFFRLALALRRNLEFLDIDAQSNVIISKNLKVCLICYKRNQVILFYWYLDEYLHCHICKERMIKFSELNFAKDRNSVNSVSLVSENWMSVVVEKALDYKFPLKYIDLEINLRDEIIWFYLSLVNFFSRYGTTIRYSLGELNEAIKKYSFWLLDVPEKYETILVWILSKGGVDEYRLRFISAALVSGRHGMGCRSFCLGLDGHARSGSRGRTTSWALAVFLEYDLSRLINDKFPFERWHHWCVRDYIKGFSWLGEWDDRTIRRILSNFNGLRYAYMQKLEKSES